MDRDRTAAELTGMMQELRRNGGDPQAVLREVGEWSERFHDYTLPDEKADEFRQRLQQELEKLE